MKEELIKEINKIESIAGVETYAKHWEKGDFHRIYINQEWYVKGGKERRQYTIGYINIDNMKFVEQERGYRYSSSVTATVEEKVEEILKK